MTRITPDHLSRAAWVYVRQSTPRQVRHNLESQGRQYALRDRAHQLGWSEVVVVDDDLGRSGGGTVRPGYDRLLAAVCRGEVGVVLSLEASRLARNGREWHTLLDYCGLVGCLLADESSVYDPRLPNDRLLLGMKGTMSEMELSTLRHRSEEALRRKAGRGELFMTVAVGYVRVDRDRIGMDPDQRVREAVALVFRKFAELGSIRQVHLWLRHEGIELPALVPGGSAQRIEWKLPVYNSIEGDRIRLRLHWHGGDHTELTVRKNRSGQHRWTTDAETGDLIRELAVQRQQEGVVPPSAVGRTVTACQDGVHFRTCQVGDLSSWRAFAGNRQDARRQVDALKRT